MSTFDTLLSEALRPQALADLNLPGYLLSSLDRMVQKGSILNLLFYGKPGIGKTSAARILIKQLGADVYELNGSLSNGDKTTVRNIEAFASTVSLTGQPKICFIDEGDYLSKEIQASLRAVIERVQHNTRFILTANEVEKLSPAIRSRCTQLNFDVRAVDAASIMERMTTRYSERLSDLGYTPDPKRLRQIVGIYFPDLRNVANHIELEFG